MNKCRILLAVIAVGMTACATVAYRQVLPGTTTLGAMQVTAGDGWNLASSAVTPIARPDSQTWTKDGLLLDRVILIPAVRDGESIFKSRDKGAALPLFRANMLPNELEELTGSTIVKLFGEGNAAVSTENLRPYKFGDNRGVMFDIRMAVTESPDYRGTVGASVVDQKLYMIIFFAATPYYYDKHKAAAEALIQSAVIGVTAAQSTGG